MNFNEIKELISIVDKSTVAYVDLDLDGCHIELDKSKGVRRDKSENKETVNQVKAEAVKEITATQTEEKVEAIKETKKEGKFIKSPIVGTFYSSPSPDKDNFVSVGSKINQGDVVCIIESMKLMNEIESDFSGEIAEILVENGAVVEYGQELFRVI